MHIEYEPPRRKQPIFACFCGIVKLFRRKVRVVVEGEELKDGCIYIGNHANKMGPMIYTLYFPVWHVKWGAHEMLGKYKDRFLYLRNVLYMQKNGVSRPRATVKAFFEAFFSGFIYKGIKVLSTYRNGSLIHSVKKSIAILKDGASIMIYPEDSDAGYFDEPKSFFSGFVLLARMYKKTCGQDVPIRPTYYHKKKRLIVAGEPAVLSDFGGASKEEVAEIFRQRVISLYRRIEAGEFDAR